MQVGCDVQRGVPLSVWLLGLALPDVSTHAHKAGASPFEAFEKACTPYMRVSIAEKHMRTIPITKPD